MIRSIFKDAIWWLPLLSFLSLAVWLDVLDTGKELSLQQAQANQKCFEIVNKQSDQKSVEINRRLASVECSNIILEQKQSELKSHLSGE